MGYNYIFFLKTLLIIEILTSKPEFNSQPDNYGVPTVDHPSLRVSATECIKNFLKNMLGHTVCKKIELSTSHPFQLWNFGHLIKVFFHIFSLGHFPEEPNRDSSCTSMCIEKLGSDSVTQEANVPWLKRHRLKA